MIELCPSPVFGPTSRKRFGNPADVRPEVGARRAVPVLGERAAVGVPDVVADRQVAHVESGPEDDRVHLALDPVGADDRSRAHLGEAAADDVDVRLRDRRIPVVRDQHPLASDRVVGHELRAQLRIGDLPLEVPHREALRETEHPRVHEGDDRRLARGVDPAAHRRLGGRQRAVDPARALGDRVVQARHDPWGGALEDRQALDLGLDLGDELDRRGAGADDRDALAGEVVSVVPARRVEHRALERVDAGNVGDRRLVQRTGGDDEDLGAERVLVRLDGPAPGVGIPARPGHLVPEADLRAHAVRGPRSATR